MADIPAVQNAPLTLTVTPEEQGMKLLRFLECRLQGHTPKSMLHKWIRTGQVRVNKGRTGPYHLLEQGDTVRMPPFAATRQIQTPFCPAAASGPDLGPGLRLLGQTGDYMALAKSAGLPTQPGLARRGGGGNGGQRPPAEEKAQPGLARRGGGGNGGQRPPAEEKAQPGLARRGGGNGGQRPPAEEKAQPGSANTDSVVERLRAAFVGEPFIPAPAHRLDKHTSGVLLAGRSHTAQRRLHALFRENAVRKEYLAWVSGTWPYKKAVLLQDRLEQQADASGHEMMVALPGGRTTKFFRTAAPREEEPGQALSVVLPVHYLGTHDTTGYPRGIREATLLLIRLLTGRKHQIRVQLASRGFPIIGDARYGGPIFRPMLLHAFALALPRSREEEAGPEWSLLPEWPALFMPDAAALDAVRESLI